MAFFAFAALGWDAYRREVVFATAAIAVGLLIYYVEVIYPAIPQELGGASPRCALLDLQKDQYSIETLVALVGSDDIIAPTGVVRSRQLDVLYSSSTFLLVSVCPDGTCEKATTFELSKRGLAAIEWCPTDG